MTQNSEHLNPTISMPRGRPEGLSDYFDYSPSTDFGPPRLGPAAPPPEISLYRLLQEMA
jgi:hypothetical protein